MLAFLIRSWKGEESLAKVFWLLYGLMGIVVFLIVLLPFYLLVPHFFNPDVFSKYDDLLNTITSPYQIFSAICVWRCAKNARVARGYLARVLVVISLVLCLISVIKLFFLHML